MESKINLLISCDFYSQLVRNQLFLHLKTDIVNRQRVKEVDISRHVSRHVFCSLDLVTSRSRLGLGLLVSTPTRDSDVGKAHRCRKYIMIFGKNRLFVRFLTLSEVMALFKFANSHSRIEPWQYLRMAI